MHQRSLKETWPTTCNPSDPPMHTDCTC